MSSRFQNLQRLKYLKGEGNRAFGSARNLLEPSPKMCFQVFALVNERGYSDKRFDDLVKNHDIEVHEALKSGYFEPDLEPLELPYEGMVKIEKNGDKYFYDFLLEPIFTTLNPDAVKNLGREKNEFLNLIATKYKNQLEDQIANLEFKSVLWARTKNLTVKFYFAIQPYTSDLCPPEDLDVLKPITIIDGHVIHPEADRLDLSSIKTPIRQP